MIKELMHDPIFLAGKSEVAVHVTKKKIESGVTDMGDYHAFNSTKGSGSGGGGCLPWKTILILAIIYGILTLIGQCKYG